MVGVLNRLKKCSTCIWGREMQTPDKTFCGCTYSPTCRIRGSIFCTTYKRRSCKNCVSGKKLLGEPDDVSFICTRLDAITDPTFVCESWERLGIR